MKIKKLFETTNYWIRVKNLKKDIQDWEEEFRKLDPIKDKERYDYLNKKLFNLRIKLKNNEKLTKKYN